MHQSFFSYSLSRPYPFRWMTPVVLIGGVAAIALITVLNVATTGYQLVSQFTTDPNTTAVAATWYSQLPNLLVGNLKPSCQPTVIPVDSRFQTNNTALTYTLTGVSQSTSKESSTLASLVYLANPLKNCTISLINIDFETFANRPASQSTIEFWGADLTAYLSCYIETQPLTLVNITAGYNLLQGSTVTRDMLSYFEFKARNSTTKASLMWAEYLLFSYYVKTISLVSSMESSQSYFVYQGLYSFTPNGYLDVTSLNFFQSSNVFQFFYVTNVSTVPQPLPWAHNVSSYSLNSEYFEYSQTLDYQLLVPEINISANADYLSKMFYFTILTDLGQQNDFMPNPLVEPDLLQFFTNNCSTVEDVGYLFKFSGIPQEPFYVSNTSTTGLGVNTSVIQGNYLCQIPQQKPLGTLIMAVLVGNFVLLQTIWKLFQVTVNGIVGRRHPEMNYCTACARGSNEGNEGETGVPTQSPRSSSPTSTWSSGAYVPIIATSDTSRLRHVTCEQASRQASTEFQRNCSTIYDDAWRLSLTSLGHSEDLTTLLGAATIPASYDEVNRRQGETHGTE